MGLCKKRDVYENEKRYVDILVGDVVTLRIVELMVHVEAIIKNEAGIHCRPSALLIQERATYEGYVMVHSESGSTTLQSALECIMLGLEQGARVRIEVNGPNEEAFAARLVQLFETEFDFPVG